MQEKLEKDFFKPNFSGKYFLLYPHIFLSPQKLTHKKSLESFVKLQFFNDKIYNFGQFCNSRNEVLQTCSAFFASVSQVRGTFEETNIVQENGA